MSTTRLALDIIILNRLYRKIRSSWNDKIRNVVKSATTKEVTISATIKFIIDNLKEHCTEEAVTRQIKK